MKPEKKGIEHVSLLSPDTQIHTAQIVRLEHIGLSMPRDRYAPSGSAIVAQATEHLLRISQREGGFWNCCDIITTEPSGMQTAVVYFPADAELHVLAMTDAEAEILDFLAGARESGTLNVLWVTPMGNQRFSLLPADGRLMKLLKGVRRAGATDVLLAMYDAVEAVHYALRPHMLRRQGIDPSSVRRCVVHYVTTPTTLDRAGQLVGPVLVTRH